MHVCATLRVSSSSVRFSSLISISLRACFSIRPTVSLIFFSTFSSTLICWKKGSSSTPSIGDLKLTKYSSRLFSSGSSSFRSKTVAALSPMLALRVSPSLKALSNALRSGASGTEASVRRSSDVTLSLMSVSQSGRPKHRW